MYENMQEVKPMCGSVPVCEPPVNSINNKINEAMGYMKELLGTMDETHIAMFGRPCDRPEEKIQEPNCVNDAMSILELHTRLAVSYFNQIRKGLL